MRRLEVLYNLIVDGSLLLHLGLQGSDVGADALLLFLGPLLRHGHTNHGFLFNVPACPETRIGGKKRDIGICL